MQLKGQAVKHKVFGKGVITDCSDTSVTVLFEKCEKKFIYPDAFSKYLTLKNDELQEEVSEEYEEELLQEKEKKDKINAKYERLDRLRSIKNSENSQAVFNISESECPDIIEKGEVFTGCYASGERKGQSKQAVRIKPNSACLLTSLKEGDDEENRQILGIFMVDENFYGIHSRDGIIKAHPKYRILLPEEKRLKLWDYVSVNGKAPSWGKTAFKYMSCTDVGNIIYDIANDILKESEDELVRNFYKYYCLVNQINEKKFE